MPGEYSPPAFHVLYPDEGTLACQQKDSKRRGQVMNPPCLKVSAFKINGSRGRRVRRVPFDHSWQAELKPRVCEV